MRIRLVKIMSGPLVPTVRDGQRVTECVRVARRAWAGQLADGAAPLQLQPSQIALPARSGEYPRVDAAERHVDDEGKIGVVAAHPCLNLLFRERERGKETQ